MVVIRDGSMLMTLAKERRWRRRKGGRLHIPVRWLGGKLHAGETFAAAAVREAAEEVRADVLLGHAPLTYVGGRDADADVVHSEDTGGPPSPLLVSLRAGGARSVSYLATLGGEPTVGDVPAMLWVPLDALPALEVGIPVGSFPAHGIAMASAEEVPPDAVALLGSTGTEHLLTRVLEQRGADVVLGALAPAAQAPATQLA